MKDQTVLDLCHLFEERTPSATAEAWDHVGLLVGQKTEKVTGAIISTDLTQEAIDSAQEKKFSLIINHHPCIFPRTQGISRLVEGEKSDLAIQALKKGISVFASHTNFDQCALEVPQMISEKMKVRLVGRLFDGAPDLMKLVYFVPLSDEKKVNEALFAAGAGQIGQYDQCSFSTQGVGTFRGLEGSQPHLGQKGKKESVQESRVETIFPRGLKGQVLHALLKSHPYEEVAYDLYSVEQGVSGVGLIRGLGYGFFGDFLPPMKSDLFLENLKRAFSISHYWITGKQPSSVKRMGFVAGKGSSFISSALHHQCDVFVTGEVGYHDAREAAQKGMMVIELGHTQSELYFLKTTEQWCHEWGIPVQVVSQPLQRIEGGSSHLGVEG